MTAWIGETFTSDAGWDLLNELVDIGNRMAGTDGERAGAEATANALEAVGLDPGVDAVLFQFGNSGRETIEASEEAIAALAEDNDFLVACVLTGAELDSETVDWPADLFSCWSVGVCERISVVCLELDRSSAGIVAGSMWPVRTRKR
jgi:hypothetical protein